MPRPRPSRRRAATRRRSKAHRVEVLAPAPEVDGRDLKLRAEAVLITAKALAICAAIQRGDRTVGFVGPPADAGGYVEPTHPDPEDG
jgi:hypothetical protein